MRPLSLMGTFAFAFAGALGVLAAQGCALSASGLPPDPAGAGAGGSGSAAVAAAGSAATGAGSTTTGTGGTGAGGPCAVVDCKDPMCRAAGYTCEGSAAQWTNVVFAPGTAFRCPAGYGVGTAYVEPGAAATACSCACGSPKANSCAQGSITVYLGDGTACGAAVGTFTSNGHCDAIGTTVGDDPNTGAPYYFAGLMPLAPSPVSCDATTTKPPLPTGYACEAMSSSGCGNARACVLPAPDPSTRCVRRTGSRSCPVGFPKRHLVLAPSDVVDGRTCAGECACGSEATTCSDPTFTGYDDADCKTNPVGVSADGNCDPLPAGSDSSNNAFFIYTATPDTTACMASASPPAVQGTAHGADPLTICCP